MNFRSCMIQKQYSLGEMIDQCIFVLKDEPGFDLTFLQGVSPFRNFHSQAQYEGVLRVFNRWNIELKYYSKTKNE